MSTALCRCSSFARGNVCTRPLDASSSGMRSSFCSGCQHNVPLNCNCVYIFNDAEVARLNNSRSAAGKIIEAKGKKWHKTLVQNPTHSGYFKIGGIECVVVPVYTGMKNKKQGTPHRDNYALILRNPPPGPCIQPIVDGSCCDTCWVRVAIHDKILVPAREYTDSCWQLALIDHTPSKATLGLFAKKHNVHSPCNCEALPASKAGTPYGSLGLPAKRARTTGQQEIGNMHKQICEQLYGPGGLMPSQPLNSQPLNSLAADSSAEGCGLGLGGMAKRSFVATSNVAASDLPSPSMPSQPAVWSVGMPPAGSQIPVVLAASTPSKSVAGSPVSMEWAARLMSPSLLRSGHAPLNGNPPLPMRLSPLRFELDPYGDNSLLPIYPSPLRSEVTPYCTNSPLAMSPSLLRSEQTAEITNELMSPGKDDAEELWKEMDRSH